MYWIRSVLVIGLANVVVSEDVVEVVAIHLVEVEQELADELFEIWGVELFDQAVQDVGIWLGDLAELVIEGGVDVVIQECGALGGGSQVAGFGGDGGGKIGEGDDQFVDRVLANAEFGDVLEKGFGGVVANQCHGCLFVRG